MMDSRRARDENYVRQCLLLATQVSDEAGAGAVRADVPIAALVVSAAGEIIGAGANRRERDGDPTAHAEVLALRAAGMSRGNWLLSDCTLYVTLEPCTMCAGALVLARVQRVVFGAWDEKAGACGSIRDVPRDRRMNHRPEVVGGVLEDACATQLKAFFAQL